VILRPSGVPPPVIQGWPGSRPAKDAVVDLDAVRDDLAGAVQQALEPTYLSVWVRRP
jgi:hypothetical protein